MPYLLRVISTHEWINDFQEKGNPGDMIRNAVAQGYSDDDLEVVEVTDSQYRAIVDAYFTAHPPPPNPDLPLIRSFMTKMRGLGFTAEELRAVFRGLSS
jgi:hypothetical protein